MNNQHSSRKPHPTQTPPVKAGAPHIKVHAPPGPDSSDSYVRTTRRNGIIARLPKMERDVVNRLLCDGVPYRIIVEALDEIGTQVSARNISNWARGGYRDWLQEEEGVTANRLRQDALVDLVREDDATELSEVGLQSAATRLSELLLGRGTQKESLDANLDKYLRIVSALCRLSKELFKLQKYRDDGARSLGYDFRPAYVKQQNADQLQVLRKCYSKDSDKDPDQAPEPPSPPPPSAQGPNGAPEEKPKTG